MSQVGPGSWSSVSTVFKEDIYMLPNYDSL
jgi:hypothetical protein